MRFSRDLINYTLVCHTWRDVFILLRKPSIPVDFNHHITLVTIGDDDIIIVNMFGCQCSPHNPNACLITSIIIFCF